MVFNAGILANKFRFLIKRLQSMRKKAIKKNCVLNRVLLSKSFIAFDLRRTIKKNGVKFFNFVFNCSTSFKIVQTKYIVIN